MPDWLILFLILSWAGPIGLGAFLAGLGVYYWGLAKKISAERQSTTG